jgi:thiamine biosynthesis lipoprotein
MRWLLLLLGLLIQADTWAQWVSDRAAIMGTRVSVQLWHPDNQRATALIDEVFAEFRRIDRLMSPYIEESELSLLNREAALRAVTISSELYGLLEKSHETSKLTSGAFDITFASVGYLYDYRRGVAPSSEQLRESLESIDYRHVRLDPVDHRVSFATPGVRIDLGGIAKGYAVDRAIGLLKQQGIQHALVTAGGDSRLIGDHRGRPWQIGIQAPRDENAMVALLPLMDEAVSTSGDYERYFMQDGVRHHHIINPKSGRSAGELQSVTIIGPNATRTDALSTSVFVLGLEAGLALVNRLPDLEAVIIDGQGHMHYSSGLMDPLQEKTPKQHSAAGRTHPQMPAGVAVQ